MQCRVIGNSIGSWPVNKGSNPFTAKYQNGGIGRRGRFRIYSFKGKGSNPFFGKMKQGSRMVNAAGS